MGSPLETDVTRLLERGDLDAQQRAKLLLPLIYEQLRGVARQRMAGERRDHTLGATVLVHEAYLKLVGNREIPWANRAHFFAAAAEAMRQILLDHAKSRGRVKRGGGQQRIPLGAVGLADEIDPADLLSLDDAIRRLELHDAVMGQVVRLRFFAGLSIDETAAALDISPATVKRRWEFARTWLFQQLSGDRTEQRP